MVLFVIPICINFLLQIVLTFIQEFRSSKAAERLRIVARLKQTSFSMSRRNSVRLRKCPFR